MGNVIVIGGGAAGMMAAVMCARAGCPVTLLEQNEKLGKKLFITGKGRCNLTNRCDREELLANVMTNSKFLYSAFHGFDAERCMEFFEQLGVRLKVERGNRVFPQSDHSSDVIRALEYELRRVGVTVLLHTQAAELVTEPEETQIEQEKTRIEPEAVGTETEKRQEIEPEIRQETKQEIEQETASETERRAKEREKPSAEGRQRMTGVRLTDGKLLPADAIILATGGVSYPLTGASRQGMDMAQRLGMRVTELYPALVPLRTREAWGHELAGLSLKNVAVTLRQGKKKYYEGFGEMLFTHTGVSGPLILSASSLVAKKLQKAELELAIDLKPALDPQQLDRRLLRDFESMRNKAVKNAMTGLLPSRLILPVLAAAGIDAERKVNLLSRQERQALGNALKHLTLTVTGTADFQEAIITQGGISVKGVNPSTMAAKQIDGLFLAGECLDLDALTGGFNLQIAWATGYLAGESAAHYAQQLH